MTTATSAAVGGENLHPDATDRALLRCVQVAPRTPFRRYGQVLGLSEQTVARRYRRLHDARLVRVAGALNPAVTGQATWFVRLRCAPHVTGDVAEAMGRRPDASWVFVTEGTDVVCSLRTPIANSGDVGGPVLHGLAGSGSVFGVSASMVLRRFAGGARDRDSDLAGCLSDEQVAALLTDTADSPPPDAAVQTSASMSAEDVAIVRALEVDGRATYTQLAAVTGLSESTTTRRTHALLAREIVAVETDIAPELLGRPVRAQLWLTVAPADVERVGRELAALPSVAFAAAVSGPHNVMAWLECSGVDALYAVVTAAVGAIGGVTGSELVLTTAIVKQTSSLTGDRTRRGRTAEGLR